MKKITCLALALANLAFASARISYAQTASPSQRTWAVIVGVSRYPKLPGGLQLQFAERDANLFADSLSRSGVAKERIQLLTGANATLSAIKSAIGNWAARAATSSDTIIFYFSGHGIYESAYGESYLLGYDSDDDSPYSTALSVSEITQALSRRVKAARVLIVADAMRKDFFDPETNTDASRSFAHAFSQLATSREGASVILANGPGEFSREGQRWGGYGVFTKHIAEAIGGEGDGNDDGILTALELFNYASSRVAGDTTNRQKPWSDAGLLSQIAVPFARSAQAAIASTPPSNPRQTTERQPPAPVEVGKPATRAADQVKPGESASASTQTRPENTAGASSVTGTGRAAIQTSPGNVNPGQPSARDSSQTNLPTRVEQTAPAVTASRESTPATSGKAGTPARQKVEQRRPPEIARVNAPQPSAPAVNLPASVADSSATSEPLRPISPPPRINPIAGRPDTRQQPAIVVSAPVVPAEAAPTPVVLELEAAIAARKLVEPRSSSAWDLFQKLSGDPAYSADVARLKPVLAEALVTEGRALVAGDVRADNISDKVDEFKRAGQILTRARTLVSDNPEIGVLDKLGAAGALIALQFYDEAERALAQLQGVKHAAVENAFGLIHHGRLDSFRAERAFKRAIELDPKWAAPHYNLALVYKGTQGDAALKELETAASLDQQNWAVLAALGDEYFTKQEWQRAADQFRKAIAVKPDNDNLYTKLGHALFSQGLQEEANRAYQKARELRDKQ
jgi:tetratricopeptide (TPR) repeat protein